MNSNLDVMTADLLMSTGGVTAQTRSIAESLLSRGAMDRLREAKLRAELAWYDSQHGGERWPIQSLEPERDTDA